MSRTTSTHRFSVRHLTHRPVGKIVPSESTGIIGSSQILSAAGSTVGETTPAGMTFSWTVSSPSGSAVDSVIFVESNGSQVRLDADVTGTYVVSMIPTYEGVAGDAVTAAAFFSPVVVPAVKRLAPDGNFMFSVLSDFWSLVNDRHAFPVMWSGYTQIVASDFLRALQIDRAKSIETIQALYQKRHISVPPRMDIDPSDLDMFLGNHQSGNSAFTGNVTFVDKGILVSPTEFLLVTTATSSAVGTSISLYSGANAGEYLINRLNSSGTGYVVSESTPFPDYRSTISTSGVDLVSTGSDIVYATSTDFAAAGVVVGDVVRIKTGPSSGYLSVVAVGTADGLTDDRTLQLSSSVGASSNNSFDVFTAVRASYLKSDDATTSTVYIPKADADLDAYTVENLASTGGEIVSDYEILVSPRHLVDSALGSRILLKTGTLGGSYFTISSFNTSRTGFIVSDPFSGDSYPEPVSYEISISTSIQDRLLILDGIGHDIASYTLLEGLPSESEGGRGDLWAITLSSATAPARREGLPWRISSTILLNSIDSLESYGVSPGDLLALEILRVDLQKSATLYCTVTGVRDGQLSFELGTSPLVGGTAGQVDPRNVESIFNDLSIPSVTLSEVTGEALYTSSALEIYSFLSGAGFSSKFFNLPLDAETQIDVDGFFSVQIIPRHIVRNTAIGLDPEGDLEDSPIFSIPALVEYISPESVDAVEDGYLLVAKDGTQSDLAVLPRKLTENSDFTVSSNSVEGSSASTQSGAATITVSDIDLVALDVRVGDTIELLSGISQGSYAISAISSDASLRVGGRISDNSLPVSTESSVSFRIIRQTSGVFLRFSSTYTAASPAPEMLWAPIVLVDNFKYIEDNFGVLVGVSREDIDRYGTTQLSYKSAVRGLMYSWATGPTLKSAEVGAHILLDAPVSEGLGEVVEVNDDYAGGRGRIVIEDLEDDGETGKGILRTYLYPNRDDFNVEGFYGLGVNPITGDAFKSGDIVYPFTALSNSVIVSDRVSNPGWWRRYGEVSGAEELKKYHTWQVEVDLHTVDSRDLPLATDFLMKIRPIHTLPKIVGVLALRDTVYVEDDLFVDMDIFFYDDAAFSRESSHMVDSRNDSGAVTRMLDFGSFSTRTLFQGHDLAVDVSVDSELVTSARGGFTSGSVNDAGEAVLPSINASFSGEVKIRGESFVRVGDVLFITDGPNRGRFLVSEVVSDTQLRISQYANSAPRGINPATHMRTDAAAKFHIQRHEDEIITSHSGISSVGATDNIIVVDSATFWSNGVTADDVLIIPTGSNRGTYHIEDLGVYNSGTGVFDSEETSLTLREMLPDNTDLSHPFEIRRRALLSNPSFSATDGVTTASKSYIKSASNPDLSHIKKRDTLTPSSGTDQDVVFRVVGVSGNKIYTDLPFTATETAVSFSISHLAFDEDEDDSDYRLERLHPTDEVELTLYRPLALIHTGTFTLTDDGVAASPVCRATDAGATDLTALATPVQEGDLLEVEFAYTPSGGPGIADDITTSTSHGMYEITAVVSDTVTVSKFFPGVVLSSASLLDPSDPEYSAAVVPETGVTANIYTEDPNFSVSGTSVGLSSGLSDTLGFPITLEEIGVVPGDIFRDSSGTEYLIVGVSGSTLTLAEDTGITVSTLMTGRILRRESP
jgi:hypothetical protein